MKIKNNFLLCLTGLPASGKSVFASRLQDILLQRQNSFNVVIIDPDEIRNELSGNEFDHTKETIVRKKNLALVRKNLKNNNITISDDMNYYTSMRHDLKAIANDLKKDFYLVYISTPLETCLKWNEQRGKPIPNDLIKKIHTIFDDFSKYRWENPDLIVDMAQKVDINAIVENFLIKIEAGRIKLKEESQKLPRETPLKKKYHEKLDSISRKIIGNILSDGRFRKRKSEILRIRKQFLNEYLDKYESEEDISQLFKKYLEERLGRDFP
ncbi:MAG: adenylyl-sulfate kinase [Candidatus Lokiarchaeota archaeon]|nr:adenylyl-sulfate kinase [Candidatus Lokiarchaeota archaeon]MBD3200478.1 adenylyl-sulfate kinase [Candidatus Lokiarchaeota archaeon]